MEPINSAAGLRWLVERGEMEIFRATNRGDKIAFKQAPKSSDRS